MPVVAEPHHAVPSLPGTRLSYALVGALLLLCWLAIFLFQSRRARATTSSRMGGFPPSPGGDVKMEKEEEKALQEILSSRPHRTSVDQLPQYPQPLLFPAFAAPVSIPVPTSTPVAGSVYGSGFLGMSDRSTGPADFAAYEPTTPSALGPPPRRRSYTKSTRTNVPPGNEIHVSGEIVVAEGWRRHTKVFGGGVCEACVENQRKMSA